MASLSIAETTYFQSLPLKMAKVVTIGLKTIERQLELDSQDSKHTISELVLNYAAYDQSPKGREAWSTLLNALQQYIEGDEPPGSTLIERVKQIRSCIPIS